ncbi:MAG: hypothetical protein HC769_36360 [Cyanobacteria bacterium CRU_2_1]|nr:hypothetical protein [Cyanobacteria bacterium CRU_2_1]
MRSRVKTQRLVIRLSEVDRQQIEQRAAAHNLDISKYVRECSLAAGRLPNHQSFKALLRQVEVRCYRALRLYQSGEGDTSAMAVALQGCLEIIQGFTTHDCEHDRQC